MAETYCGKDCQVCSRREELACPGCKNGPGLAVGSDCDLAECVIRKNLETCDGCSYRPSCGLMWIRESMPADRLHKREREQRRQETIARKAPILGKWLWVLFWMMIPGLVAGLLDNEILLEYLSGEYTGGIILQSAVSAAYALVLLMMGSQVRRYRTAGICGLIACGITIVLPIIDSAGLNLLLGLPGIFMPFVYEYQEFAAHSDALWGVENTLAYRWKALWNWKLACYCALVVGVILAGFFVALLGALLILVAAIGLVVVDVLKMVFLFTRQTRKSVT